METRHFNLDCGCGHPHPFPVAPHKEEAEHIHHSVIVDNAGVVHHSNNVEKSESVKEACNVHRADVVENSVNTVILGEGNNYQGELSAGSINALASSGNVKELFMYKLQTDGVLTRGNLQVMAGDVVIYKNGLFESIALAPVNSLNSNDTKRSLSLNNGKVLDEKINAIVSGNGRMLYGGSKTAHEINTMVNVSEGMTFTLSGSGKLNNNILDVANGDVVTYTTINNNKRWYKVVDSEKIFIQKYEEYDHGSLVSAYDKGLICLIDKQSGTARELFHVYRTTVQGNVVFVFNEHEFSASDIKLVSHYVNATQAESEWHTTVVYSTKTITDSQKTKLVNLPSLPTVAGNYQLKVEVIDGTPSYSWELVQ